ncbi:MAG: ROK family transcriptional regulator [Marinosulfonomonas sp.]
MGRQSRSELARNMGLNRSSAGHIIAQLASKGLVREMPVTDFNRNGPVRTGRPGILLELVPDAAIFLGVEIGVEHISVVKIDLSAKVKKSHVIEFKGTNSDVEVAVKSALDIAFAQMSPFELEKCKGIGISTPAQMDQYGHVSLGPILGWVDVDLAPLVRKHLPIDIPVQIENDANAFAFGETYLRQDADNGVTLFLLLETGVGGAIVIDGTVFRGGNGLAGEIGHLRLSAEHETTLENYIGLEALLDMHRKATNLDYTSFESFLEKVRDREPNAVLIAEKWASHIAFAFVQVSRMIDPNRIVIGGSVSALYPLVQARVAAHIKALQDGNFPTPEISVDNSGWYGSALGAACMLHNRFLSIENEELMNDVTNWQEAASSA